jgi:hypothetical protein
MLEAPLEVYPEELKQHLLMRVREAKLIQETDYNFRD